MHAHNAVTATEAAPCHQPVGRPEPNSLNHATHPLFAPFMAIMQQKGLYIGPASPAPPPRCGSMSMVRTAQHLATSLHHAPPPMRPVMQSGQKGFTQIQHPQIWPQSSSTSMHLSTPRHQLVARPGPGALHRAPPPRGPPPLRKLPRCSLLRPPHRPSSLQYRLARSQAGMVALECHSNVARQE